MLTGGELRDILDFYLSIAATAKIPPEQVYTQVLAWKGTVSARQQAQRRLRKSAAAKNSPEVAGLFAELGNASDDLASEFRMVPRHGALEIHRRQLAECSERVDQLQQQLAIKSQEYRRQLTQARCTAADVAAALPNDAVLVDFLEYSNYTPPMTKGKNPEREQRLAAFVVRRGKPVDRIELGPAASIDHWIAAWRRNFGATSAAMAADPGQALRRLVWEKLQPDIAGARLVLISPDGGTARLPWAALPGKQPGTFLIEDLSIAEVPIARLLPELLAGSPANSTGEIAPSLLLVGAVDFGADPGRLEDSAVSPGAVRGDEPRHWQPLPGTAVEVAAVKAAFLRRYGQEPALELCGALATKRAVQEQMSRFRYLHFSTHGFFASAGGLVDSNNRGPRTAAPTEGLFARLDISAYHPDLLSGLVLAGANRPVIGGQEDGLLTALEVSDLDLSGVEMATLSACETGLGQAAGGEGLLGLQRAFQVAGAKTTVASLWQVPDKATELLMQRFYDNLWNGERKMSKLDALLDAQRWLLREGGKQTGLTRGAERESDEATAASKSGRLSPYYWAAFVLSGDWR